MSDGKRARWSPRCGGRRRSDAGAGATGSGEQLIVRGRRSGGVRVYAATGSVFNAVLGALPPSALAVALSPIPIIAIVLVLGGRQARPAFLCRLGRRPYSP
jgi:hypothetical protein